VETLRTGDLVRTLHHGPQSIRWIGKKAIKLAPNFSQDKLRPIQISIGALGQVLPHKPLTPISPTSSLGVIADKSAHVWHA
tara:strand:- start:142 stop:384 length:243 start_codon:yes stop_codon:yes gene_type:complete